MHADFRQQIETAQSRLRELIVMLDRLAAAPPADRLVDATVIDAMRALGTQISGFGWRGLSGLLRSLSAGLIQRTQPPTAWPIEDIAALRAWLQMASQYLDPGSTAAAAQTLLPHYDALGWTPLIAGALRDYAQQRLQESPLQELLTLHNVACAETTIDAEVGSDPQMIAEEVVGIVIGIESDADVSVESVPPDPASLPIADADNDAVAIAAADDVVAVFDLGVDDMPLDMATDDALVEMQDADAAIFPSTDIFETSVSAIEDAENFAIPGDAGQSSPATTDDSASIDVFDGETFALGAVDGDAVDRIDLEDAAALVDAETPAPDGGDAAPLWLSVDERSLLSTALTEQLLPLLLQLQSIYTFEAQQTQLQEYAFQLGLVGNAFEHCGLTELLNTIQVIIADASSCEDEPLQRAIPWMNWQIAVVDWLDAPQDESRQQAVLDAACDPHWPLAFLSEEVNPLRVELARVRVGLDPALRQQRKTQAQWQDVALEIAPDVLPSVLDGMLRQLPQTVAQLSASVRRLAQTGAADDIDSARRAAHALKGDANLVGVTGLAQITHAMEDILVQLARAPAPPEAALAAVLGEASDCVEAMSEYVLRQGPAPDDALDVLQSLLNWSNALLDGESPTAAVPEIESPATSQASNASLEASAVAPPAAVAAEQEAAEAQRSLVVGVPLLDELLRLSSETIVLSQQVAEQLRGIGHDHAETAQQTRRAQLLVNELDDLVSLRGAALSSARLQGASVDPLELDQYNELHVLTRRLQEANTDERAFVGSIEAALSRLADLMAAQERMQNDLQSSVLRTRMVPVSQVVPRFQRAVRIAARSLIKELELTVIGADTLVDSEVIETIVDPLMHALRNAADHGIEDPEQRRQSGKPAVGQITLRFEQISGNFHIELSDDGRGLDYAAIQRKAQTLGMLNADAPIDRGLLNRLILAPGFSTRSEATQMSGRGIGMDVIATRVRELKGRLRLHSEDGRGTRIEIILPSTLVSAHVAVAWTGSTAAAWVSASFNQFVAVRGEDIHADVDGWRVQRDGEELGVIPLALLLGIELRDAIDRNASYVAAECDTNVGKVLVLADRISEMRSIIVKSPGPYVPSLTGVRGAAVLGNGGIAPVIDLTELLQTTLESQHRLDFGALFAASSLPSRRALVIDDSLSVRRALSTLLTDAGFDTGAAIDGLDAMRLIDQQVPDVLLVDMEMPRMNGLELTSYLRSRPETSQVPIIMITSRSTERHRDMAEVAGVDGFLVKPYLDEEVLALVASCMAARTPLS